jgi:molybdate-binding protein
MVFIPVDVRSHGHLEGFCAVAQGRLSSHWRRQGLMHRRDTTPPVLADLSVSPSRGKPALRFVNRQPGSGTRLLLAHLLAQAQLDP